MVHDIVARMRYRSQSLEEATQEVINKVLMEQGGSGGLIAMDKDGNIAMPFNSTGMFRGYLKAGGEAKVFIFSEE